jgi:hypothetical protein
VNHLGESHANCAIQGGKVCSSSIEQFFEKRAECHLPHHGLLCSLRSSKLSSLRGLVISLGGALDCALDGALDGAREGAREADGARDGAREGA